MIDKEIINKIHKDMRAGTPFSLACLDNGVKRGGGRFIYVKETIKKEYPDGQELIDKCCLIVNFKKRITRAKNKKEIDIVIHHLSQLMVEARDKRQKIK